MGTKQADIVADAITECGACSYVQDPLAEDLKKANFVIKNTMCKYIYSRSIEEKEYYGKLVDMQVEFFCEKFNVTPLRLWLYF